MEELDVLGWLEAVMEPLQRAIEGVEQAIESADARVKPWQAAIAPGDRFIANGSNGLLVFGEVMEGYAQRRLRHYRICRCYSVECPEGKRGDVHVSTVACRVSRQFFEEMRRAGWAMEGLPPSRADTSASEGGAAGPPPHGALARAAETTLAGDRGEGVRGAAHPASTDAGPFSSGAWPPPSGESRERSGLVVEAISYS